MRLIGIESSLELVMKGLSFGIVGTDAIVQDVEQPHIHAILSGLEDM